MESKRVQSLLLFLWLMISAVSPLSAKTDGTSQLEADQQLFEKAVAYSFQRQWDKAEALYREILERNGDWPEPRNNLAVLLFNTNRIDEARMMLEQAVMTQPSFRISQSNRTQLYNYLASLAYNRALGEGKTASKPEMEFIEKIHLPVKVIEKTVEVVVEKTPPAGDDHIDTATELASISSGMDEDLGQLQQQIGAQLNDWARAWSEGHVEEYLGNYSDDFKPDDGRKSFEEWKNIRRARLRFSKSVDVSLDNIRLFVEPNQRYALVEFEQRYHSSSYSDRVLKQLYMHKPHPESVDKKWLILAERVIKTY